MAKQIPLGQSGLVAIVDDEDFEWINSYRWHLRGNAKRNPNKMYAVHQPYSNGKKTRQVAMHRLVMGIKDQLIVVDHIDHNGLNNQKANLRICSPAENTRNSRPSNGRSSRFKGVNFHKQTQKWCARITSDSKTIFVGLLESEEDAARHYNAAAVKYHGEFACLNDVDPLFPKSPIPISRGKVAFRGVSVCPTTGKYLCNFRGAKGLQRFLGAFDCAEDAARRYNLEAHKELGSSAKLNNLSPLFPASDKHPLRANNSTGYRGVSPYFGKYKASIGDSNKHYYLGTFPTPEDAARAYDAKARELRGNRARLNFPDDPETGCQ